MIPIKISSWRSEYAAYLSIDIDIDDPVEAINFYLEVMKKQGRTPLQEITDLDTSKPDFVMPSHITDMFDTGLAFCPFPIECDGDDLIMPADGDFSWVLDDLFKDKAEIILTVPTTLPGASVDVDWYVNPDVDSTSKLYSYNIESNKGTELFTMGGVLTINDDNKHVVLTTTNDTPPEVLMKIELLGMEPKNITSLVSYSTLFDAYDPRVWEFIGITRETLHQMASFGGYRDVHIL